MAEPGERKPRQPNPKPEKDDRPQAERFIETARQLGADETGERFEKAFGKLVPAIRRPRQ